LGWGGQVAILHESCIIQKSGFCCTRELFVPYTTAMGLLGLFS
jgi:hypothetical protein